MTVPQGKDTGLLVFHQQLLRASAIADDVIAERGYQSISRPTAGDGSSRDRLKRLGIPAWARDEDARFPGLLIPLWRATGEQIAWQYRPDRPPKDPKTGRIRKYASPAGRASVLDVHPRHRSAITDPTVPLWITEGVKKADSLTSQGLCAIALSGVWNWRSSLGSLGDWEDVQLRGRWVIICYDSDVRGNQQVGRAMERLGRWLKSKGAAQVTYVVPPGAGGVSCKGVDDFFAAGGTLDLLWQQGASARPPVEAAPLLVDPEGYMVDQLAEDALDGRWLWAAGLGWLRYDDRSGRWVILSDKDVMIQDEVRRWLKDKHADAARALADAVRRGASIQEVKHLEAQAAAWRGACNRNRIGNLAALARGLLIKDASDFDAHPDLLNCPNGVVDLRTRQLGDHDPGLLFTRVTKAKYVPGARHPDWDKALEAVPADVLDYVQLRYGQAITGHIPPDDVVLVQLGKGSNGKTTLVYACQGALGREYFQLISERAVIADKSQHPTELMDFRGARLAVLEELAEDRRLTMRRIKIIMSPEIKARFCGKDDVTFDTTHALIISTNHDPLVYETDNGSWRRLMALRFPYRYWEPGEMPAQPGPLDRPAERGLRERLRSGEGSLGEAVLAWLAEGAHLWYEGDEKAGRAAETFGPRPERIRKDTAAWRAASNPMFSWATDMLVPDPGSHVWSAEVVSVFADYLTSGGHPRSSDQTILARFAECCDELGWKLERREAGERSKLGRIARLAQTAQRHGNLWKMAGRRSAFCPAESRPGEHRARGPDVHGPGLVRWHPEHVDMAADVIRGADAKTYPAHPLSHSELNRLRWLAHNLHCEDGLSVREVQRVMAGQHGVRRSVGAIARDLRLFACKRCEERPETA